MVTAQKILEEYGYPGDQVTNPMSAMWSTSKLRLDVDELAKRADDQEIGKLIGQIITIMRDTPASAATRAQTCNMMVFMMDLGNPKFTMAFFNVQREIGKGEIFDRFFYPLLTSGLAMELMEFFAPYMKNGSGSLKNDVVDIILKEVQKNNK